MPQGDSPRRFGERPALGKQVGHSVVEVQRAVLNRPSEQDTGEDLGDRTDFEVRVGVRRVRPADFERAEPGQDLFAIRDRPDDESNLPRFDRVIGKLCHEAGEWKGVTARTRLYDDRARKVERNSFQPRTTQNSPTNVWIQAPG